jgi:hypothetical protein
MTLYIEATTLALKQSQRAVSVDSSLTGNIVMRIKMCGYSSPKLMPRFSLKQKTQNEDKRRMRSKRDAMIFLVTMIASSKERTAEFQRLPIIKALQDRDDAPLPSDTARPSSAKQAKSSRILESELKRSKLIGGMIDSDLKKWANTALVALDSTLGRPNWKCSSTKFLHPAERVTARFICTLCSKPPKKGATVESFSRDLRAPVCTVPQEGGSKTRVEN